MPMLADPAFCELAYVIGVASLAADDAQIWHLTKLYWCDAAWHARICVFRSVADVCRSLPYVIVACAAVQMCAVSWRACVSVAGLHM